MHRLEFLKTACLVVISFCYGTQLLAGDPPATKNLYDWPQFRGPNRNGISTETGWLKDWPKDGPEVLWRRRLGDGYSGISVAGGKVYTMYARGDYEYVVCFEEETGLEFWTFLADKKFFSPKGVGPRATPLVDGDLVFALSAKGILYALKGEDRSVAWQVSFREKFDSVIPKWGFCGSPIVVDDMLIVEVGSSPRNAIVAFDKASGDLMWRRYTTDKPYAYTNGAYVGDEAAYSSPVLTTFHRREQLIFFTGSQFLGITPKGEILWSHPWTTRYGANVISPVPVPENRVFITSGYKTGAALFSVHAQADSFSVQTEWKSDAMQSDFSTPVLHDGYLYGISRGRLICVDVEKGKKRWSKGGFGHGNLIMADGHLIVLSERGELVLAKVNPKKYRERDKADVFYGKCWTAPALANGKLFLRNQFEIICLDLRQPPAAN